jgi:hypothetical protein
MRSSGGIGQSVGATFGQPSASKMSDQGQRRGDARLTHLRAIKTYPLRGVALIAAG